MENTYDNVLAAARQRMVAAGRVNHVARTLMTAEVGLRRKPFDPKSAEDRLQFAHFVAHGKWKDGKSFYCEWPHASVPDTVRMKLIEHFLGQELAQVEGRNVFPLRGPNSVNSDAPAAQEREAQAA